MSTETQFSVPINWVIGENCDRWKHLPVKWGLVFQKNLGWLCSPQRTPAVWSEVWMQLPLIYPGWLWLLTLTAARGACGCCGRGTSTHQSKGATDAASDKPWWSWLWPGWAHLGASVYQHNLLIFRGQIFLMGVACEHGRVEFGL